MKPAAIVAIYARGSHVESLFKPGVLEGAYRVAKDSSHRDAMLAMILLTDCKIWEVVIDPSVLKYIDCPMIGEIEL